MADESDLYKQFSDFSYRKILFALMMWEEKKEERRGEGLRDIHPVKRETYIQRKRETYIHRKRETCTQRKREEKE